jgi:hypothetical protein
MLCRVAVLIRWWPVVAFLAIALAVQHVVLAGYDARGHAADHLGSAQVVFFGSALVATLLWSTPRARRQLDVVVACGAWIASLIGVAVGNLRVVDAIAGADWTDEQAATLGDGLRGFESGHDLAELCSFLGVAAAIVLTVVLFVRRHISRGVLIGAIVVSVLFPPWIVPGAGVLVVTIALCIARERRLSTRPEPQPLDT